MIDGRDIAAGRALTGMKQGELAKTIGVSANQISLMESRRGKPAGTPKTVAKVITGLRLLGVVVKPGSVSRNGVPPASLVPLSDDDFDL